jgi:hypothetical protein
MVGMAGRQRERERDMVGGREEEEENSRRRGKSDFRQAVLVRKRETNIVADSLLTSRKFSARLNSSYSAASCPASLFSGNGRLLEFNLPCQYEYLL